MNEPVRDDPIKFGLQPTPPDARDFQLGQITFLPDLDTLPAEFLIPYSLKHQRSTDFCSAYMSCAMSEPQEHAVFEPSYSFAVSKEISGDKDGWGQNLRDALKSHVRTGALPIEFSPFSVDSKPSDFLRDIENWKAITPNLTELYRKQSYFKVTGQYNAFDNARTALHKFKSPIGTGVLWGWSLSRTLLDTIPQGGFGHAVTIIGFTKWENGEDVLILLNSYGKEAGKDGLHYITRDVYNHFANFYGHYMFLDLEKEDAKWRLSWNIKLEDNWLIQLCKILKSFFLSFLSR